MKPWPVFDEHKPWHIYSAGATGLTDDGREFRYQSRGAYIVFEDNSIRITLSGDRQPDVRTSVSRDVLPMVARSEWGRYEFFCPVQGKRIPKNAIHTDVLVIHPELEVAVASGGVTLWSQTHVPKSAYKITWHTRNKKREAEWREKLQPLLNLGHTLNALDSSYIRRGRVLGALVKGIEPFPLDLTSSQTQHFARSLSWEFSDDRLEEECRDQHEAAFISVKEK